MSPSGMNNKSLHSNVTALVVVLGERHEIPVVAWIFFCVLILAAGRT